MAGGWAVRAWLMSWRCRLQLGAVSGVVVLLLLLRQVQSLLPAAVGHPGSRCTPRGKSRAARDHSSQRQQLAYRAALPLPGLFGLGRQI